MPTPRRRAKPFRGVLTDAERHYLRRGYTDPDAFASKRGDTWHVDMDAARAAWEEHRAEIWDATPPPLVPWAAIVFDGESGHSSPYCALGAPHCHSANDGEIGVPSMNGGPK